MAEFQAIKRARSVSLGFAVVALYAVFVLAVFAGFASYIYRSEWQASLSPAPQILNGVEQVRDIDNLIYIVKREATLQTVLKDAKAKALKLNADAVETEAAVNVALQQIDKTRYEEQRQAFHTLAELRGLERWLEDENRQRLADVLDDKSLTTLEKADSGLRIALSMSPSVETEASEATQFTSTLTRLKTTTEQLVTTLDARDEALRKANQDDLLVKIERDSVSVVEQDATTQLAEFQKRLPVGSPERARLSALAVELPGVGRVFQFLVSLPTIFLTLTVTIASGGLGTVVAFSRRYYAANNAEALTMSRLFVNVGEGIAAAMAIFLFSGAGMLALTQGGGGQTQVELSPYTVAFIAFLSGFMAEDAFGRIESAGKKLFDPGKKPKSEDDGEAE